MLQEQGRELERRLACPQDCDHFPSEPFERSNLRCMKDASWINAGELGGYVRKPRNARRNDYPTGLDGFSRLKLQREHAVAAESSYLNVLQGGDSVFLEPTTVRHERLQRDREPLRRVSPASFRTEARERELALRIADV